MYSLWSESQAVPEREVQVEEKRLIWVGRAKEELLDLPKEIRSELSQERKRLRMILKELKRG